jgi:hypothetical protein
MFAEAKQETGMEQAKRERLAQDLRRIMASPSTDTWCLGIEPCVVSGPDCDVQPTLVFFLHFCSSS